MQYENMEWHLKVPKILHVYWGAESLPYLRFKTVESFMQLNPDWKVILSYPKIPSVRNNTWGTRELGYDLNCTDYFEKLNSLPIEKNPIDFKEFGFSNDMAEVHKSDFIRLHLLSTIGGVWSDMDILYFKSITSLLVNKPVNKDKDTFISICWYGHSIAFLMASENNTIFNELKNHTHAEYRSDIYQCIGSTMYNKYFKEISSIPFSADIGMSSVYPHDAHHIEEIYDGTLPKFTDDTIGMHWYAGHRLSGGFLNATNGGLHHLPNNILGNLLK
jgi:hypothetical protein